jgi:hypothetical protein
MLDHICASRTSKLNACEDKRQHHTDSDKLATVGMKDVFMITLILDYKLNRKSVRNVETLQSFIKYCVKEKVVTKHKLK